MKGRNFTLGDVADLVMTVRAVIDQWNESYPWDKDRNSDVPVSVLRDFDETIGSLADAVSPFEGYACPTVAEVCDAVPRRIGTGRASVS